MKKFYLYLLAGIILTACFVSCSNDAFEDLYDEVGFVSNDGANGNNVEATIPDFVYDSLDWEGIPEDIPTSIPSVVYDALGTRTEIMGETTDKRFVWSENDTIGIFPSEGSQVAFSMANGAGTKSAIFDGGAWTPKPSATYSAYYPFIGDFYLDATKIPLNMTGQVQKANGSSEHIAAYDYMTAANATVGEDGNVAFNFSHLVGILHIFLQVPEGTYKSLILETSGSFVTEATLNLTDGTITSTKQSAVHVLSLDNITVADGELLEAYMAILPTDLTGKVVSAKIYDTEGVCYTATLAGKNYQAGTFYNVGRVVTEDILNTRLPVVIINTPNNVGITSKDVYVDNTLISIINAKGKEELSEEISIKGRGNSTWNNPKKPYAIKFSKKQKVLSMPKDKSWVLLANYFDATLMRNDIAFYMGTDMSMLDYTPRYQFVNLILNGENKGIYQLGEKLKISEDRVNVGDDGFLVEIDTRAIEEDDARYFKVPHISQPINIKDPDVEYDDMDFLFAKDYVTNADNVLFSTDFVNIENGWQKYMDMESFVDWYLINEISKNNDAIFYTSCYMNFSRNGKLKMGPIWDFDIAFGGYPWNPRGDEIANVTSDFYIKTVAWYKQLFTDPVFESRVRERFNAYFNSRQKIYDRIDANAIILKDKIVKENKLWGRVSATSASDEEVKAAYQQKVDELKEWIEERFQWLNSQIN